MPSIESVILGFEIVALLVVVFVISLWVFFILLGIVAECIYGSDGPTSDPHFLNKDNPS